MTENRAPNGERARAKPALAILGCVLVLIAISAAVELEMRAPRESEAAIPLLYATHPLSETLNASAECAGGRVVVSNMGSEPWQHVRVEVNGRYTHTTDAIPPHETFKFLPGLFTSKDGRRLYLISTGCQAINIHATVNGRSLHWKGAYH